MLDKEEIEICKQEARNYIEFMKSAGDNAGWTRGLLWYIEELEKQVKEKQIIDKDRIKFLLNGCDISFFASAPKDITLEQLLKQCDRIKPDYCACGIRSLEDDWEKNQEIEIIIDYNDVKKANKDISCKIKEK